MRVYTFVSLEKHAFSESTTPFVCALSEDQAVLYGVAPHRVALLSPKSSYDRVFMTHWQESLEQLEKVK